MAFLVIVSMLDWEVHIKLFLLILLQVILSVPSSANESIDAANILSTNNNESFDFTKLAPQTIRSFSIFAGPSLGNLNDPVDEEGVADDGAINTWSQVSFQWKINEQLNFIANPRFVINHNANRTEDKFLEWADPVFGIAGIWFQSGDLSIAGSLNTIIPVLRTRDTKEDSILFNPGGFNNINYKINEKFSIGSWVWARGFFYDGATELEDERFSFFVAPLVNLVFSDKTGMTIFYQINGDSNSDYKTIIDNNESLNMLFTYRLNDQFTIEPMITLFRESRFSGSKANLNVWLSGRLF